MLATLLIQEANPQPLCFRLDEPRAGRPNNNVEGPQNEESGSALWPRTDWTGLGQAARSLGQDGDLLNCLILKYRLPLKGYLVSTFPDLKTQADEILQDFAQDRILKEGWLGKAGHDRGRFRHFLRTSLRNFVRDRVRAQARSPASLEELELDPAAEEAASSAFDLTWARMILAEVLDRMERDCRTPGKEQPRRARIWEVFRLRILSPELDGEAPMAYEALVERISLVSPIEAQNLLATAKRIFRRHLNQVIAEYERQGEATRKEIAELKHFLAAATGKNRK